MVLNHKQLIGLSVQTKSGQQLGAVKDFELNVNTHQIDKYLVTPSKLVGKLLARELMIDSSQVIEITQEAMIVEDGLISRAELVKDPASI